MVPVPRCRVLPEGQKGAGIKRNTTSPALGSIEIASTHREPKAEGPPYTWGV